MTWMLLVLLYGILKGVREIAKKLAMEEFSVMEVLVAYTVISFVFCFPQIKNAMGLEPKYYGFIAFKSFCIFLAWIASFHAIKRLPVSLYGILDLSRVVFSMLSGVFLLGEVLSVYQICGLVTVCAGLLMLRFRPKFIDRLFKIQSEDSTVKIEGGKEVVQKDSKMWLWVTLAFVSCFLNAVSAYLDKVLMKEINSSQMQFWYMAFMVFYYFLYCVFTKTEVKLSVWKNGWVWLMAIIFVIGDKALFIANANPDSRITVMTLVKQSACLVTIIGGKFIFKEKNIAYKLFCASIIIGGIILGVIK